MAVDDMEMLPKPSQAKLDESVSNQKKQKTGKAKVEDVVARCNDHGCLFLKPRKEWAKTLVDHMTKETTNN